MPDHPDTATPTETDYTRYFTQLQHLERLLYRHRRYRLLGTTLLTACAGMGILSYLQGATDHALVLSPLGIILSLVLMAMPNARPTHNHLKIVLLVERTVPPGSASPLPREAVVSALGHSRRFVRRIADWIDAERQRCMMDWHHQEWDRRHGL